MNGTPASTAERKRKLPPTDEGPLEEVRKVPKNNNNNNKNKNKKMNGAAGGAAERLAKMAEAFKTILESVGEDVEREGIVKTPMRAAKAMLALTDGYDKNLTEVINEALFEEDVDQMVVVRDINFSSLCEHHLLPFKGTVSIGYLPNGRVLGLSKFARVTKMYSRRLQVQERMTREIAEALNVVLQAKGLGVRVEAEHMCMAMRGVERTGATTVTTHLLGAFKTDDTLGDRFLRQVERR